jgi:hypothetical protein
VLVLFLVQLGTRAMPDAWKKLNTDFPNYYLTARLVHEHFDASRVYEWTWFERQKDHRDLDQRIVGMVPITGFSTLFVYPLTSLPPLMAKHRWIVINIVLLMGTMALLRGVTKISWRRIALVVALSFPLRVNFLYGQYYVLLLFLLTLACYLYLREKRFMAGLAIGVATGLKVFPGIFLLYFLRKRDLRAFAGGVAAGAGSAILSIVAFGWQLHHVYLAQVLPRVMRGEGLDPYNLKAASLSSLLHRLFIYEPLLNPHPAVNAAWLFAVFHPLLQMLVIAPALLLAVPRDWAAQRIRLEWAALLVTSLAISTSASPYLFTVLILPACLLLAKVPRRGLHTYYLAVMVLYVATGWLSGIYEGHEGWAAILAVPRLYACLLFCLFAIAQLKRETTAQGRDLDRLGWAIALGVVLVFSVVSNLRQQRGVYDDYRWRALAPANAYMTLHPVVQGDAVHFISLLGDGYHSGIERQGQIQFSSPSDADRLSLAAGNSEAWVEETGNASTLLPISGGSERLLDGQSPTISYDGRHLAFIREDHGSGRIIVRDLYGREGAEMAVTPPELNVLEASFRTADGSGGLVFSAESKSGPSLFTVDESGNVKPLGSEEARYPAVSKDGRWLAYSKLQSGSWNLEIRDLANGQTREVTHAACNVTEPAWAADSKTLFYASDCGRALWFSVICKRQVIP